VPGTFYDDVPRRTPKEDDLENLWWSLHRQDFCPGGGYAICTGSRLVVVFYLLTNGGQNPICDEFGAYGGCNESSNPVTVTPLDPNPQTAFTMASEVLFHALTNGCAGINWQQQGSNWPRSVGSKVMISADFLYGPNAENSVRDAFKAIGYPPVKFHAGP